MHKPSASAARAESPLRQLHNYFAHPPDKSTWPIIIEFKSEKRKAPCPVHTMHRLASHRISDAYASRRAAQRQQPASCGVEAALLGATRAVRHPPSGRRPQAIQALLAARAARVRAAKAKNKQSQVGRDGQTWTSVLHVAVVADYRRHCQTCQELAAAARCIGGRANLPASSPREPKVPRRSRATSSKRPPQMVSSRAGCDRGSAPRFRCHAQTAVSPSSCGLARHSQGQKRCPLTLRMTAE